MKWKKILSFAIVSVLVMSGLAVISGSTRAQDEGTLIEEINFDVVLDMEDGVAATAEGDTTLFMHGVDGVKYQQLPEEWRVELDVWEVKGSYNCLLVNPAHEGKNTTAINDAISNGWISSPDDVQWLANNYDGDWTVNPFAHDDIRFAMQYLDRQSIVEDLLDGLGSPRYAFMGTNVPAWNEYFSSAINDQFDLDPEGDQTYMENWVQQGMEEIQANLAFGNLTQEDGDWYYEHSASGTDKHQIEVIIMARSEDWRQDLGDWMQEILVDMGFDAVVDPTPSDEAIPRAFFGTPEPYDNLDYHIYTGGWVGTTTVAYQHAAAAQMYAPWYYFMQTHNEEDRWTYDDEDYYRNIGAHESGRGIDFNTTVAEFDWKTMDLFVGNNLETEDQYWNELVEATQMGFVESVRIFLTTGKDFYPYNTDSMKAAVPEATNGYDTYFGPRTMRTDDGVMETEILTGADRPYMDNWNLYGGSADVYGEYQRRAAREYGSWLHPQDGMPMQVNNYWMSSDELDDYRPERNDPYERNGEVVKDFSYNETGALVENITIPDTAVDWVPANRTWMARDELIAEGLIDDNKSAVKVTIDVHEEHTWHDGSDFSIQDLMANYAREKTLGDPTNEPYLAGYGAQNAVFWNAIDGFEWNEAEGTYTVWGSYTFPVDDLLGSFYSLSAEAHPLTYEAWDHLHGGDATEYGGEVATDYDYEPKEGSEWIHQLSSTQNADLVTVLQAMNDGDWIPYYLRDSNNAPIPMDASELTTEYDSVIDFIQTHDHSYLGMGPFVLDEYDEEDHTMTMVEWDDYGYPQAGESAEGVTFEYGYWAEQFQIEGIGLTSVDADDEYFLGEEIEATGIGVWEEQFPEPAQTELTESELEDYRFVLRNETGVAIVTVGMADVELTPEGSFSTFDATIPTGDVPEGGSYFLYLEARQPDTELYERTGLTVTFFQPTNEFAVEITSPADGDEFAAGDVVTVEYSIESGYDAEATETIAFNVDGTEVETEDVTIDAFGNTTGTFTWEAEGGDHDLEVAAENTADSVSVTVTEEEDGGGIPGFTVLLMVVSAVVAVAIYYNKEH